MDLYSQWYQTVESVVQQKAKAIKLLICDIDGVFSDGSVILGNSGEEMKAFNTKDGFGIKALMAAGIDVAVITGRKSTLLENRMKGLGVNHIYQGMENKIIGYTNYLKILT
jgi:3-deoxy-D-manno-octulosonate 8-phosphate phosphatase (KDO 8-P phosphatase)